MNRIKYIPDQVVPYEDDLEAIQMIFEEVKDSLQYHQDLCRVSLPRSVGVLKRGYKAIRGAIQKPFLMIEKAVSLDRFALRNERRDVKNWIKKNEILWNQYSGMVDPVLVEDMMNKRMFYANIDHY